MKTQVSLALVVGLIMTDVVWASALNGTSNPTPSSTPTLVEIQTFTPLHLSTFTPSFTPTPMVAPTWAPQTAGEVPENLKPKKPSPWMSSAAIGVGLPMSQNIQSAYTSGFDADLGTGLKVTDQFSVWIDFDLDLFNSKNDSLTQGNNFTLIEAALWARYLFLPGDFSPYFFIGPGVGYNEYRSNQGARIDVTTGYGYIPVNNYEIDLLGEGGVGMEMRLGLGLAAFLQGKMTYDFTSSPFARYGSTDSPLTVVPLELGMIFGI